GAAERCTGGGGGTCPCCCAPHRRTRWTAWIGRCPDRRPGNRVVLRVRFLYTSRMRHPVTLIRGDGTGPELAAVTKEVLEATGVAFEWREVDAGVDVMEQ